MHRKRAANFEVRELAGGKSSIAFSYRIVGRRKDIKGHRRFAKIDTRLPLRMFACGGAPVPRAVMERSEEQGIPAARVYGLTELHRDRIKASRRNRVV